MAKGASAGLHNLGKTKTKHPAHLLSRCKNCIYSVYGHQPKVWQFRPRPGWVHTDCDNPNGAST